MIRTGTTVEQPTTKNLNSARLTGHSSSQPLRRKNSDNNKTTPEKTSSTLLPKILLSIRDSYRNIKIIEPWNLVIILKESGMTEKFIGPVLPTNFAKDEESEEKPSRENYGPALPPHLLRTKKENVNESEEDSYGVNVIGPILPGSSASTSAVQEALEERAQELKYKFLLGQLGDSMEPAKRESWMTELPPEKAAHLGLGPRKFKKNYNEDSKSSRSAWTETPADRKKKDAEDVEEVPDSDFFEAASTRKRNEVMDEIVEKSKKHKKSKKSLTLLELHQKKMKKKMKKKSKKDEKPERRPFDRDVDLQVNRFDEAQKKVILKKAQLLDTRFNAGKSKYL